MDTSKNIEQLWITINVHNLKFIVGSVYRPPTFDYKYFLNELENTFSQCLPVTDKILCLGDFNIDILNGATPAQLYFNTICDSLGLVQIINHPTRLTKTSASLIDFILVSDIDFIKNSGVSTCQFSDHDMVFCCLTLKAPNVSHSFRSYRDLYSINWNLFHSDLRSILFHYIFFMDNVDDKITFFNLKIIELFDKHAPLITRRFTKRHAPWITDTIKLLMTLRDKAKAKFRKTKSPNHWEYYKQLRFFLNNSIKHEKSIILIKSHLIIISN